MSALTIGLMSGTSLDGVDGVLVDFQSGTPRVLQHVYLPFEAAFATELLALNTAADNEIHRGALAANTLARQYAIVVRQLLAAGGIQAADVAAVGAHGQTVRHRPQEFDGCGYTAQLNNPSLLAELTGIDVVADFRSRDVAAGGQGAPLVPAFHQDVFGQADRAVCVVNIGGISNITLLPAHGNGEHRPATPVLGFDCGPGNALMDHWCQRHTGQTFDHDGAWADTGIVDNDLLARLLTEPYLDRTPPKSTGRDLFNPDWLNHLLVSGIGQSAEPPDVQATLCEFTAAVCHAPDSGLLIVCGGGARNSSLMRRLQSRLPTASVEPSDTHGLPALQVEAAAFAWLARKTLARETGSLQSVTGARGARILGAIYPR
jgi:anhydro-N-acetylmuramic acid kinase